MMIESSEVFGVKKYQALSLYRKLFRFAKKSIKSEYDLNVLFCFDDKMDFGDGAVGGWTEPIQISIGIKDLFDDCHSSFDTISDFQFICPIVAVFHEAEHVCQFSRQMAVDDVTDEDVELSVSGLARMGNNLYYRTNYSLNLREIRAQQVGISDSYLYLCSMFPDVKQECIESVILDYVDFVSGFGYFIDNKGVRFESLDAVDVAFDMAFERSKITQRQYSTNVCDNVMDIMRYVDKYQFVIDSFQDSKNAGYKQDEMIACLNLCLHPEFLDSFDCLKTKGVDLSDVAVFGRSVSERNHMSGDVHDKRVSDASLRFGDVGVGTNLPDDGSFSRPLPDIDCSDNEHDDIQFGD